ncbi:MAG TPA: hypothetical protein VNZ64_18745 [Candidatus Acidoferrum sp.]|nr:hypothetical protein [Candidatus Acidoferrum sp.]
MLKRPQKFTSNKQVVRDLQCEVIRQRFANRLGSLSYFGLPSSSLEDVAQWSPLLQRITAVERGETGKEWEIQNELLTNAFRLGFSRKLTLLRGDIDSVLISDVDSYGNKPSWPYDIISLDYSGGLFYQNQGGQLCRLEAIKKVFQRQAASGTKEFLLFLSFNLDHIDQHEVNESLKTIRRDLVRFGYGADQVIESYLKHPKEQARLKLYVMNLAARLAAQESFDSESESPIFYLGNRDTQMMAFRFYLKRSSRTFTPRSPKERLNQLVNRRMIEIVNGKQNPTNLRLPLIKAERQGEK